MKTYDELIQESDEVIQKIIELDKKREILKQRYHELEQKINKYPDSPVEKLNKSFDELSKIIESYCSHSQTG